MKRRAFEQTLVMSVIKITDSSFGKANLFYLYNRLAPMVSRLGGKTEISCGGKIGQLSVQIDKSYSGLVRAETEDKISDVVAVNYKYDYFKKKIKPKGLDELQYELLLDALISADLEEDKRYVRAKMALCEVYSISGTFNFRMGLLKDKWAEITSFIPPYFNEEQLREFIVYLMKEKKGKKVYVENEQVFDKNFNKCEKILLTDFNLKRGKIVREILLSGAGEVELNSVLTDEDEKYVREYFKDKITFGKDYFKKTIDKTSF